MWLSARVIQSCLATAKRRVSNRYFLTSMNDLKRTWKQPQLKGATNLKESHGLQVRHGDQP